MKIYNNDHTDFSDEVMLQLALMYHCVMSAEIIGYRMDGLLQFMGEKGNTFGQKKVHLRETGLLLKRAVQNLEKYLDDDFGKICSADARQSGLRHDFLMERANEIVQLLLIYYSRIDGQPEKNRAIQKAIMNFKPSDLAVDIREVLKYYDFKD